MTTFPTRVATSVVPPFHCGADMTALRVSSPTPGTFVVFRRVPLSRPAFGSAAGVVATVVDDGDANADGSLAPPDEHAASARRGSSPRAPLRTMAERREGIRTMTERQECIGAPIKKDE